MRDEPYYLFKFKATGQTWGNYRYDNFGDRISGSGKLIPHEVTYTIVAQYQDVAQRHFFDRARYQFNDPHEPKVELVNDPIQIDTVIFNLIFDSSYNPKLHG